VTREQRSEPPVDILDVLRQRGVPVDSGDDSVHRAETVGMIERTIFAEKASRVRRRAYRVVAVALVSVSALAAGWYGVVGLAGNQQVATAPADQAAPEVTSGSRLTAIAGVVVSTHDGDARAVAANDVIDVRDGDEIRTSADGSARLALPRAVSVELGAATKLWMVLANEVEQRVRLDLGQVAVAVPNPGGPKSFVVRTPDSEVIVHGTRFTVDVASSGEADGTVTSVGVSRGSVLVVHGAEQRLVRAGDSWSSAAPTTEARSGQSERVGGTVRSVRRVASHFVAKDGTLTEQNRLFQEALDARANGDDARVVRSLDSLLARFPESALAPEARLLRVRTIRQLREN
jgi:ferric-dicitrate binding protein FerR (iron transport regulator)